MSGSVLYSVERELLCKHGRHGPNHNVMDGARVLVVCCPPTEVTIGSLADVISVAEAVEFVRINLSGLSPEARTACRADLLRIMEDG